MSGMSRRRYFGGIAAAAGGLLAALPQGYETLLSRWLMGAGVGADLSGGEWQKIALARVFMRHRADFLVLEEPTAALDAAAEAAPAAAGPRGPGG